MLHELCPAAAVHDSPYQEQGAAGRGASQRSRTANGGRGKEGEGERGKQKEQRGGELIRLIILIEVSCGKPVYYFGQTIDLTNANFVQKMSLLLQAL